MNSSNEKWSPPLDKTRNTMTDILDITSANVSNDESPEHPANQTMYRDKNAS